MADQKMPTWWCHSSNSWEQLANCFRPNTLSKQQQWQKLAHGITNDNYQLTTNDQRYFIQIVNDKNLNLLPQVDNYPDLTQLTVYTQLKPWLATSLLQSPQVRIFEWIDAPMVKQQLVPSVDYQLSFLTFIAILHSENNRLNSVSSNLPSLNISAHLSHYEQLAFKRYCDDQQTISAVKVAVDRAQKLAEKFSATTFCHNDLSLSNQLWNKKTQRLTILDWEYACFSDPIFELANYFNALQLSKLEQLSFVKHYQAASEVSVDLNKLNNMQELTKITNYLWSLVAN